MLAAVVLEIIKGCLGSLGIPGAEDKLIWLRLSQKLLDELEALSTSS